MKKYLIRFLGGYSDFSDFLSRLEEEKKHECLTLAVKKLYNTINEDDILQLDEKGNWIFQGKILDKGSQQLLSAEAAQFLDSKLWKILKADIQYLSNKKMFLQSTSEMDLIAGKLWQYTLDTFKTRLKSMKKGSPIFNK